MATPPTMPVAPPIAAPRAAPGPPPAAAPMAAPEAAPITPPPRPRCTGSYGFVQADRPNTNAAMTHGTVRVTIVSVRSSTGPNRQRQRIHRTLSLRESSASALRAQRACSGTSRKTSWPSLCVAVSLRRENSVQDRNGSSAGLRTAEKPSDLASGGSILSSGRCRAVEGHSVEQKLAAIFAADVEGYSRLIRRAKVARQGT